MRKLHLTAAILLAAFAGGLAVAGAYLGAGFVAVGAVMAALHSRLANSVALN